MYTYNLEYFLSSMSKQVLLSVYQELAALGISVEVENEQEQELRNGLLALANSKEDAKRIYTNLSTAEQEVLHYFIFHVDDELLSFRQIDRSLEGIKPSTFRIGLTKLRRKGIIYTVRRQWGEIYYAIPVDVAQLFYQIYTEQQELDLLISDEENPTIDRQSNAPINSILVDIFLLMDHLRIENRASIPLTKKGGIHKRNINLWQELLPNREDGLQSLSLQVEDPYTKHIALLIDFLTHIQVIVWFEDRLQLDLQQADKWMEKSRKVMRREILDFWLSRVRPSTSWLYRYLKDMLFIQDVCWRSTFAFIEIWEEQYSLPEIEDIRQMLYDEILYPLHHLGLLELGSTDQEEGIWRWREEQDEHGEGWLQPTLELYTPSFIAFSDLWKLTQFFSLDRWEEMLVLKLSKQKSNVHIQRGNDVGEWLQWLGEFCTSPIPEPFLDQLSQVQKNLQQAKVSDVTLIELNDTPLVEALMKWPEVGLMKARQVGAHYVAIPLENKNQFISLLEKKGVKVFQEQERQKASNRLKQDPQILTKANKVSHSALKVESIFPDLQEAIPEWSLWPELWKKNLSSYHLHTKKDILDKAVQYEIKLRMEWKDGSVTEMIPSRCLIEHGRWMCYDQKQKSFDLEDMHKLQMIFPYD